MGLRAPGNLLPPLILVAALFLLPISRGWPGRHPSAPRGLVVTRPPAPEVVSLVLTPGAGLVRAGAGWAIGAHGGTLTISLPLGSTLRSVSLAARLSAPAAIRVAVRTRAGWRDWALSEPVERDGPGAFAVDPIAVDTPAFILRLSIGPGARGAARPLLYDVRALGTVAAGGAPPAARSARGASTGTVDGSARALAAPLDGTSPTSLRIVRMLAAPAGALPDGVIPRVAWGCPDGEASPQWVPFYQRPFHFIVHHTAAPPGPGGPIGDVQDTWSFHTFAREWGDIGYNYVIDQQGRVYEGRAGGYQVVGAHTHDFNYGAVGIALIGDFNVETPPAPMLQALQRLVTTLANRYGIDPQGMQNEHGVAFATLAGHRDFNQTDCPGQNVYSLLPGLRRLIARDVRSGAAIDGPSTLYATAGRAGAAIFRVRNSGTTTWNGRFSLVRISGPLLGLPGGYNLPGVPPGSTISIPLFVPAERDGAFFLSRWRLYDASGIAAGSPFDVALRWLAPGRPTPTPPPATATPLPTATVPTPTQPPAPPTARPAPSRTPAPRPSRTGTPRSHLPPPPSATPTTAATRPRASVTAAATFTPISTSTPRPSATAPASPTVSRTATSIPSATTIVLPTAPVAHLPARAPGSVAAVAGRPRGGTRYPPVAGLGAASLAPMRPRAPLEAAAPGPGATVRGASTLWYFAEGSSATSDREELSFLNPGMHPVYVVTTLVRGDGRHVYAVTGVPSRGRGTLEAGDAAGQGDLLAAVVRSTGPIYAERALYHGSQAGEGTGAALAPGLPAPALHWYLPHPRTRADERERLAILNPGAGAVRVTIAVVERGALRVLRRVVVPPLAVRGEQVPGGAASAVVTASGQGVVVEESTRYAQDRGFTLHSGLTGLSTHAFLIAPADDGRQGYLLLLNPGGVGVQARVTGPGIAGALRQYIPAMGQAAVRLAGLQAAGMVQLAADRPIAASYLGYLPPGGERSLARSYRGSASSALIEPASDRAFAAGDTRLLLSDPQETLLLANPGTAAARIRLTALATGGRSVTETLTLAGGAETSQPINGWSPPSQHGLVVTADHPVLAVLANDFNEGVDELLSSGLTP